MKLKMLLAVFLFVVTWEKVTDEYHYEYGFGFEKTKIKTGKKITETGIVLLNNSRDVEYFLSKSTDREKIKVYCLEEWGYSLSEARIFSKKK